MNDKEWSACPTGTFREIKDQLPSESRSRGLRPVLLGAAMLVLMASIAFGLSLLKGGSPEKPVDLICQDCVPLLEQYHAGELSEEMQAQVAAHLDHCRKCSTYYRAHYLEQNAQRESIRPWAAMLLAEDEGWQASRLASRRN